MTELPFIAGALRSLHWFAAPVRQATGCLKPMVPVRLTLAVAIPSLRKVNVLVLSGFFVYSKPWQAVSKQVSTPDHVPTRSPPQGAGVLSHTSPEPQPTKVIANSTALGRIGPPSARL